MSSSRWKVQIQQLCYQAHRNEPETEKLGRRDGMTLSGGYPLPGEPPGPKWLRAVVGIDFLDNVSSIYLSGTPVSDLAPLTWLKSV
jgi:hypothetical protein